MKRSLIFSIVFVLFPMLTEGQKSPIKFGNVSINELQMKSYPEDTSATAVILCDYGYFDASAFQFTETMRIKILKKEGSDFGTNVFPANAKSLIKGITFNLENGKIVETKLRNESIYPERVTEDYYRMRVAMPDVREGSVLDIQITYPGMPYVWRFQSLIPEKYSELIVEQNPFIVFTKNLSGFEPLNSSDDVRWIARNMPAFKPEPYMNSAENYLTKMEIDLQEVNLPGYVQQASGTWESICNLLLKQNNFGKALDGSGYLSEIAKKIQATPCSRTEKLKLAYETIKNEVKWDEKSTLLTSNPSLGYVFKMKTGNSADINLMLIQLLKKLDFDVLPVLLSTRENGILSPVSPSLNKLNYVIARVNLDGKTMFLDATEPYMPYYLLPLRSLNYRGQTFELYGNKPVEISTDKKDKKVVVCNLKINDDFGITGNLNILDIDYAAYDFRKNYSKYNNQDAFLDDLRKDMPGLKIRTAEIRNIDSVYLPVEENYDIVLKGNNVENIGEIILAPSIFDEINANPFKAEERKYPVDFGYNREKTIIITITIPEKFTVTNLPKPMSIKLPGNTATYYFEAVNSGNTIRISGKYMINKPVFAPNEYKLLKEFYNQIIKKQSESIILRKI
jgi:hypothetical protein